MEFERTHDEEINNYKALKNQLEQTLKRVTQTIDLREAKGYLIEIQNNFKGLKLFKEDREELYSKLQDSFAEINQKIEDERNQFNNEALLNYNIVKVKVEEAFFLACHPKEFKETWEVLIEVQTLLRNSKLLREHRDILNPRLQEAFEKIKIFRENEKSLYEKENAQNYVHLSKYIEETIVEVSQTEDYRMAKDLLISAQSEFRNVKLAKEKRDELYSKIQDSFTALNARQDKAIEKNKLEAENQYSVFKTRALNISEDARESTEFKQLRIDIKEIQAEIRDSVLLKGQRDDLHAILQEAFETVNQRQDNEQISFELEASNNYKRLKALIKNGLNQAEISNEYKETREFLKKIQSEFKGIKLIKEQREELYSRLQSAFEILNKRVDEYFHEKKRNWEVKMQYRLSSLSTEIFELNKSRIFELNQLKELEDFLLNIETPAVNETKAVLGLKARISSKRINIERKEKQIKDMESEMAELKNRIGAEE